jgi:hypothetical protein
MSFVFQREIADVVSPGETVVWEGRPVGCPWPTRWRLALYAALAFVVLGLPLIFFPILWDGEISSLRVFVGVTEYRRGSLSPFEGDFTISGNYDGNFLGTIHISYLTFLGFVASVVVAAELWRIAGIRARRYGITDRRVIALDRFGRMNEVRRGTHEPRLEKRALVYGTIRLDHIADSDAALEALHQTRASEEHSSIGSTSRPSPPLSDSAIRVQS